MATYSGQKTVTTAGTEVALGTGVVNGPVMIKALAANTGTMYIGNVNGAVSSSTGMPLAAGEVAILNRVNNLADVLVDSSVNGEGVAWLALEI